MRLISEADVAAVLDPDSAVTALRAAFAATMTDREFLADAGRFQMEIDPLSGEAVGLGHHLVLAVADDHLAVVLPRLTRGIGGRQDLQEPLDLAHGVARELLGVGEENGRGGRPVLGLSEQVGRAHLAVHAVVGDHQRLGRSREQVDADAAEQLPLGLRDIGVAGADDLVHARNRTRAVGHGRNRMRAADTEKAIDARLDGGIAAAQRIVSRIRYFRRVLLIVKPVVPFYLCHKFFVAGTGVFL